MNPKRREADEKGKLNIRENKTKDSDRNKSFVSESSSRVIKSLNTELESICIGTEEDGMESITFVANNQDNFMRKQKNKFCLFCYQSFKPQENLQILDFCSEDCEERYNHMFKIYENNLVKAEEEFKKDHTSEEKEEEIYQENDDDDEGFDLLDEIDEGYEDFDYESYEEMKRELGGL